MLPFSLGWLKWSLDEDSINEALTVLIESFQNHHINKHLIYSLLDLLLNHVWPDVFQGEGGIRHDSIQSKQIPSKVNLSQPSPPFQKNLKSKSPVRSNFEGSEITPKFPTLTSLPLNSQAKNTIFPPPTTNQRRERSPSYKKRQKDISVELILERTDSLTWK